ncbi:hypothetical protein [Mucilaginibacter celer]|uniref:Uncharacterized protein n=1 Tax=Mucilaginibacter celer TaxID=2305508 RepID=A0A494W1D0_9SPHI|nr:hypothetical protein [Mucilaginibacter celer]AYL97315.1 hypothetical protein HYN43_019260 [Mucilaginibacter celer]
MDTQDKELDMLFKQQLDDLEIQPSAAVWQGISSELNTRKRKRVLLPLLSAAASVMVLVTAGILFIPKHRIKNADAQHSNRIAKTTNPVKQPTVVKIEPMVPPATVPNKTTVSPVIAPVNTLAQTNKPKTKSNLVQPVQQPVIESKKPADAPADQPLLAQTPVANYNIVKTTNIDSAVTIQAKPVIINNEKPQQALIAQAPIQPVPSAAKSVKKHRIRSIGDVFNVMIAAVDKRKDKVIEFTNTDEDDATITGVNLGFIKVKKEKDK